MTERKKTQQLRDIAKRYPDDYLFCRDAGHSWQSRTAAWLQDGNIERTLMCQRCSTHRVQTLDKNGYLLRVHYTYSDGYPMVGMGRLDTDGRAIFRRASVLKSIG